MEGNAQAAIGQRRAHGRGRLGLGDPGDGEGEDLVDGGQGSDSNIKALEGQGRVADEQHRAICSLNVSLDTQHKSISAPSL